MQERGHRCRCESTVCDHGDGPCTREADRLANVMFLRGEPMCEPCESAYFRAGFGIDK